MTEDKKNSVIPFAIVISITLIISVIALLWSGKTNHHETVHDETMEHKTMDVAESLGGDFVLQSADGPVSLADYRGKIVVLYFGYAFCPDICPTSLGLLSLAIGKLKPGELGKIQTFFISVDPERDTVEKLKIYVNAFHSNIIGITGTAAEIADVAKRYGVIYRKAVLSDSALGYSVDHSSRYYVIDANGEVEEFIEHGTSPDEIVATLRTVMK